MDQERDLSDNQPEIEIVEGLTFGQGAHVAIDGKHFKRCQFSNCTLVYGGGNVALIDCDIDRASVSLALTGSAATTVRFLMDLGYSDLSTLFRFDDGYAH